MLKSCGATTRYGCYAFPMEIGTLIKKLRERRGLSQQQLAEIVGVSQQAVDQWEQNKTGPRRKYIPRLANALRVSTASLDPIFAEGVRIKEVPPEVNNVPLYTLTDLAIGVLLDPTSLAANLIFPASQRSVSISEGIADAFAIEVTDDLMSPDYEHGDILIAERNLAVMNNDDVIAQLPSGQAVLRRYISRGVNKAGHHVYDLVTPNAETATITVQNSEARILGIVTEVRRRKRRQ